MNALLHIGVGFNDMKWWTVKRASLLLDEYAESMSVNQKDDEFDFIKGF